MPDVDWQIGDDEAVAYVVPFQAENHALTLLRYAGFDTRSVGNAMPNTMHGHVAREHAYVAIVVPSAQAAKAGELLRAWEHEGDERVEQHKKRVPLDLLRVVLVVGLFFLGAWIVTGTWRVSRLGNVLILAAVAAGGVGEWLRFRQRRRARAAKPPDLPESPKQGRPWFDPKSGRVRRRR